MSTVFGSDRASFPSWTHSVQYRPLTATPAVFPSIFDYIRNNLADPELSPAGIAAHHNVSVRQLYKLCASAGIRIEQWIISQRLAWAHTLLSSPANVDRSIAAVAHTVGFRDPTHFSRRFRAAYGMTPRACRADATGRLYADVRAAAGISQT